MNIPMSHISLSSRSALLELPQSELTTKMAGSISDERHSRVSQPVFSVIFNSIYTSLAIKTANLMNSMQVLLWALTALSFFFVLFRLYAELISFRRLFTDDYMVIFAWTIILTTAII